MDNSQYYGYQSQTMEQRYNSDGTFQLSFNGNLNQQRAQNQNDYVPDNRDRSYQAPRPDDQHQQKLYVPPEEQHQYQPKNLSQQVVYQHKAVEGQQHSRGSVQDAMTQGPVEPNHPASHCLQQFYLPQPAGVVSASYLRGSNQGMGFHQFSQQQPGPQLRQRVMMHQQPSAYHPREENVVNHGQVQNQQNLPHSGSTNGFIADDCNQGQYQIVAGTHNQQNNVTGTNPSGSMQNERMMPWIHAEQNRPVPYCPEQLHLSQPSEQVRSNYPVGPYQSNRFNQFAQQRLGHYAGERVMDFQLHQQLPVHHPPNQQYPPHTHHHQYHLQQNPGYNDEFVHYGQYRNMQNFAGTHNQQQFVTSNNNNADFYQHQQNMFDWAAQEKPRLPEKPMAPAPPESVNKNDPFQIQHMTFGQSGQSYLQIGVLTPQQMTESPRTQQLTSQMEQHTIQSSSENNLEPVLIKQAPSEAQKLTHRLFQVAQNGLLPVENPEGPQEKQNLVKKPAKKGNNEGDDQWEPLQGLDDFIHDGSKKTPGNNETDGEWFEMDTSDYNYQIPIASTNTAPFVNFYMDNNEVQLPLVRVQKPRAPRGSKIPKVSTSRQTSFENVKRHESFLHLSPPVESPKKSTERSSRKENTPQRARNRGYTNTYNVKKKKILEDAKRESEEAFDRVQELKESILQKEEKARFAIKLLMIMGRAPGNVEERYKKERKEKMEEFDAKEEDDGIKAAKEAKQLAERKLATATALVAAGEANASKKTRAGQDLKLKSHLLWKQIHENEYKRELKLQRPVHNYVCRTVGQLRPFLDPPFRFQLEAKMQEYRILEQLRDFERFALSYQNPFKRATEQEDKIK